MARGDTFIFQVQVLQPPAGAPPGTPPVPTNITGWFLWFTAKYTYVDPDSRAVSALTSASSAVTITQPVSGTVVITMPPIATYAFPDGPVKLVYDVQGKDTSGNIYTIETGTITVYPDVTRAIA